MTKHKILISGHVNFNEPILCAITAGASAIQAQANPGWTQIEAPEVHLEDALPPAFMALETSPWSHIDFAEFASSGEFQSWLVCLLVIAVFLKKHARYVTGFKESGQYFHHLSQ